MLSGFAVFGLGLALEFAGADLAGTGRKWFQLVLWTGFVFGVVAYLRSTWLARPKGLIAFISLLTAHILVLVAYLRGADGFPNLFFLIFSPIEAALLGFLVGLASGRIGRRKRPNGRPPDARFPRDTT